MSPNAIFLPVLAQIFLVFVLYLALSVAKSRAVKRGEVDEARRSLYEDAWPESVMKINNCIRNQFEVPVLFYAVSMILWALKAVNLVVLGLACLFVLTRIGHAYIHTGSNYVPTRRRLFMAGCVVLLVMFGMAVYAGVRAL